MPRGPTRKASYTQEPGRRMTGPAFVRELAVRQRALLDQMVQAAQQGALEIDNSEDTDRYIEHVVSDWCTQQEPDLDSHMKMLGAVFLWALLDTTYGNEVEEAEHRAPSGVDLAFEALRTIQAIWGVKHG